MLKKYSFLLSRWRQGCVLAMLLLLIWGQGDRVNANPLFPSVSSALPLQSVLISQMSLPTSVETAVRQEVSRRTRLPAQQLQVKQSRRQTWPDGCLGLGTANELCTQALVEGWRVVITHKNQTWVYRTDETGAVLRLES